MELSSDGRELGAYVDMPAKLARLGFGIEISRQTLANWSDALILTQKVDDIVDSGDQTVTDLLLDTINRAALEQAAEVSVPVPLAAELGAAALAAARRLERHLTPPQRSQFARLGAYIINLRPTMGAETDVAAYAAYTRREAEVTALMMGAVMQPAERQHPDYARFMQFLKAAGGSYNIFDSIIDLRADHRTNLTKIKPNPANHVRLVPPMLASLKGQAGNFGRLAAKAELWQALAEPLAILIADRARGAAKRESS